MTPTERLRVLVRDRMTVECQHCHDVTRLSLRDASAASGTPFTVISRFLNGGEITSGTFDQLSAWVERPAAKDAE